MLIFFRPPWASQYADPSTLGAAHLNASHFLFDGNVGIFTLYENPLGEVLG